MSKTSQFLRVLYKVSLSPSRCLPESTLKDLLGNPPRSTWHRLINELLEGSTDAPALLIEVEGPEERQYCLNIRGWQAFLDAHEEGKFLLECYRQIGYLLESDFTNMIFEIPDLNKKHVERLDRKFLNLVKVQARRSKESRQSVDVIIQALIEEHQLEVTYDGGLRVVRPLTLCQHRDDLYLMCYRMKDEGIWEKRTYKISRISKIRKLEKSFPYPPKSEWDPASAYSNASGLVLGESKLALIRVYGLSRKIFAEKEFFGAQLTNRERDRDTYACTYTNANEFLGQLFVYAEDIEIVDDDELTDQFLRKAQAGISRNTRLKIRNA